LDCEAAGAAAAAWILLATVAAAAAAWIVERTLAAVDAAVAAVRSMRLATVVAAVVAAALGLVLVLLARRPLVLPPPALQLLSPLFPSQWTVP
jgi:hypothetical protein